MTELRSRRNQLILIVVALLAVLLLLGFWLQNSFSARISDLEKSQNAQQQEFSTELGDVKNKINSVTVDDREVGGDVAVVGGGDTTTNQNRTNTTQNDSTNVSSDVGSSQNGARGENGADGTSGTNGSDGAVGQTGPQGPSGVAACPNGNCLSLQGSSPGTQEPGSVNISGDGQFGGTVSAGSFSGDGANVTNVDATTLAGQNSSYYQNASNINSGTLSDGQLSSNVTLQGNTFNGASQLVQLSSGGILPMLDGSQLTNVLAANAMQLGGQAASYYLNASNLNSGTLSDVLLSSNVTLQGNTFNGANQLVKLAAGGGLPVLDGSQLTDVDAKTLDGQLAAFYLNASNINGGTLADARLSANVALKNATNTFTGTNNFAGLTATGILQNGYSVCSADNNCNYAASSGSTSYIQNGTTAQAANFNISGAGQIGGNLTVAGYISSPGAGAGSEKFGSGATAAGANSISIGNSASASVSNSIAIGRGANVHTNGNAIAIGYSATAGGNTAVALGQSASANGYSSTALGGGTIATGSGSVAIGAGSSAGDYSVAIGRGSIASGTVSVAIGRGAVASSNYTFVAGGETGAFDNVFFGKGEKSATPTNYTINGTAGLGTNIQGGAVTIAGGRGTGSASGGAIQFQTSNQDTAGTTLNGLTTKAQIGANGNATFGGTADLGQMGIINDVTSESALVVQGAVGQTGDLFRLQNASATSLFNVASSGNVGIGAVAAGAKLTVFGSTFGTAANFSNSNGSYGVTIRDSNDVFLDANTNGGSTFYVQNTKSTGHIQLGAGRSVSLSGGASDDPTQGGINIKNNSGTNLVRIQGSSGKVGIGTDSPISKLHIRGTSAGTVGQIIQGATGQTADLLQLQNSSGSTLASVDAAGVIRTSVGVDTTASNGAYLRTYVLQGPGGSGTINVAGSLSLANGFVSATINSNGQNAISANQVFTGSDWSYTADFKRGGVSVVDIGRLTDSLRVMTRAADSNGIIVRGVSGQAADLLQTQNSSGAVLSKIDASGNLTVKRADIQGEYISFSNNIRGYNNAVASAATTQAVTFGSAYPDANYAVFCTPNWNTTCFVSNKTMTGFTLNFGTAAPAGQLVDWFVAK